MNKTKENQNDDDESHLENEKNIRVYLLVSHGNPSTNTSSLFQLTRS